MERTVAAATMPVVKCPVRTNLYVLYSNATKTIGTKSIINAMTTAGIAAVTNPVVAIRQPKAKETPVATAPKATAITTIHFPREVRRGCRITGELKCGAAFKVSAEVSGLFSRGVRTSIYTTKQTLHIKSRPIKVNIATQCAWLLLWS